MVLSDSACCECLRAEGGVELRHQAALAASSVVPVKHVLALRAVEHLHSAANSHRSSFLVASGNCELGTLHQRTAGRAVRTIEDSIALVRTNSLSSGFTVSQGTAFPNTWRQRGKREDAPRSAISKHTKIPPQTQGLR